MKANSNNLYAFSPRLKDLREIALTHGKLVKEKKEIQESRSKGIRGIFTKRKAYEQIAEEDLSLKNKLEKKNYLGFIQVVAEFDPDSRIYLLKEKIDAAEARFNKAFEGNSTNKKTNALNQLIRLYERASALENKAVELINKKNKEGKQNLASQNLVNYIYVLHGHKNVKKSDLNEIDSLLTRKSATNFDQTEDSPWEKIIGKVNDALEKRSKKLLQIADHTEAIKAFEPELMIAASTDLHPQRVLIFEKANSRLREIKNISKKLKKTIRIDLQKYRNEINAQNGAQNVPVDFRERIEHIEEISSELDKLIHSSQSTLEILRSDKYLTQKKISDFLNGISLIEAVLEKGMHNKELNKERYNQNKAIFLSKLRSIRRPEKILLDKEKIEIVQSYEAYKRSANLHLPEMRAKKEIRSIVGESHISKFENLQNEITLSKVMDRLRDRLKGPMEEYEKEEVFDELRKIHNVMHIKGNKRNLNLFTHQTYRKLDELKDIFYGKNPAFIVEKFDTMLHQLHQSLFVAMASKTVDEKEVNIVTTRTKYYEFIEEFNSWSKPCKFDFEAVGDVTEILSGIHEELKKLITELEKEKEKLEFSKIKIGDKRVRKRSKAKSKANS